MSKPQPPDALKAAGKALWVDVVETYDLRVDELRLLLAACKSADRIEMLETAHADLGLPFLTKGSMGQDVIHPLIAEMRTHEAHQAGLLAKLKLPDESGAKPNQQRDAAQSRWAQHGAGA